MLLLLSNWCICRMIHYYAGYLLSREREWLCCSDMQLVPRGRPDRLAILSESLKDNFPCSNRASLKSHVSTVILSINDAELAEP